MVPWESPRQCGSWTLCEGFCWLLLLPVLLLLAARPAKLAAFPTSLSDCQTPTGWNCSGESRTPSLGPPGRGGGRKVQVRPPSRPRRAAGRGDSDPFHGWFCGLPEERTHPWGDTEPRICNVIKEKSLERARNNFMRKNQRESNKSDGDWRGGADSRQRRGGARVWRSRPGRAVPEKLGCRRFGGSPRSLPRSLPILAARGAVAAARGRASCGRRGSGGESRSPRPRRGAAEAPARPRVSEPSAPERSAAPPPGPSRPARTLGRLGRAGSEGAGPRPEVLRSEPASRFGRGPSRSGGAALAFGTPPARRGIAPRCGCLGLARVYGIFHL